ncbi:UPF0354 protein [Dirofilaria immitis]
MQLKNAVIMPCVRVCTLPDKTTDCIPLQQQQTDNQKSIQKKLTLIRGKNTHRKLCAKITVDGQFENI